MEVKINAMCMNVPEEFRILSAEERAGMQFLENGEGEILQDNGRHIMISAAWKKHGRYSAFQRLRADIAWKPLCTG